MLPKVKKEQVIVSSVKWVLQICTKLFKLLLRNIPYLNNTVTMVDLWGRVGESKSFHPAPFLLCNQHVTNDITQSQILMFPSFIPPDCGTRLHQTLSHVWTLCQWVWSSLSVADEVYRSQQPSTVCHPLVCSGHGDSALCHYSYLM